MIDYGPGDCFTAARAWHGWLGKARRPKVLLAWPVRQGSAREGVVWIGRSGTVRLARNGRHGFARYGLFRHGWLGVVGIVQGTAMQARPGSERYVQAQQARCVGAWPGLDLHGRRGMALPGQARQVRQRWMGQDRIGRRGVDRHGSARHCRHGVARSGAFEERHGTAGMVRQGSALQGDAGKERHDVDWRGTASQAWLGLVCKVSQGIASQAWPGLTAHGVARLCSAGVAWIDGARHRKALLALLRVPNGSRMGA